MDLGKAVQISKVKIWNRMDCCSERLRNVDILVSNNNVNFESIAYKPGSNSGQAIVEIGIPTNAIPGRFLRIQLRGVTEFLGIMRNTKNFSKLKQ